MFTFGSHYKTLRFGIELDWSYGVYLFVSVLFFTVEVRLRRGPFDE